MGDIVKQSENNKRVPVAGFNVHPENINKKGRPPRGWAWSDLIEEAVNELLTTKDGLTIEAKKAIIKKLIYMAIDGDINAIKEIINRMDGMPNATLQTDITSGGKPVIIQNPLMGGTSNVSGDTSIQETTKTK
jgi:hypothetical protein